MKILEELCVGCGTCLDLCPGNAISLIKEKAKIDEALCTECKTCIVNSFCPHDCFDNRESANSKLRKMREQYSSVSVRVKDSLSDLKVQGIKNANAIEFYKRGSIGIRVEVGRPNYGTTFREVQSITEFLVLEGIKLGEEYSITYLLNNDGNFQEEEILDERVSCIILGFTIPVEKAPKIFNKLVQFIEESGLVVSIGLISRLEQPGNIVPLEKILEGTDFSLSLNVKANLDLPVTPL